jgi:hypothetical protein
MSAHTSRNTTNVLPAVPIALVVVGLGMVLIAGLAGTVLWLLTRRRTGSVTTRVSPAELRSATSGGEPAEA